MPPSRPGSSPSASPPGGTTTTCSHSSPHDDAIALARRAGRDGRYRRSWDRRVGLPTPAKRGKRKGMANLTDLQNRFSSVPGVRVDAGQGGLTRVVVSTPDADAHVYLQGAHVTHYQPKGGKAVLFMSGKSHFAAGKAIRGGVPLIFPWFGAKADNPKAPQHGFARSTEWELRDIRA